MKKFEECKILRVQKFSVVIFFSKIEEKTIKEINEIQKIENKEKTKTKNIISSKVYKQIFFDIIDKIQDEETQRNYLKKIILKIFIV